MPRVNHITRRRDVCNKTSRDKKKKIKSYKTFPRCIFGTTVMAGEAQRATGHTWHYLLEMESDGLRLYGNLRILVASIIISLYPSRSCQTRRIRMDAGLFSVALLLLLSS